MKADVTLHVSVWVEIHYRSPHNHQFQVTLHVSVWVEIDSTAIAYYSFTSRSTWACELKWNYLQFLIRRKWSRSTWACELKSSFIFPIIIWGSSRSTWACELKYFDLQNLPYCHRVTLHVSVWVEIFRYYQKLIKPWSRSTWACELKYFLTKYGEREF